MPSPLQSNWRLYLAEPLSDAPPIPTVAFVYNVMDSLAHVAGTRLFSDALPSHWPARFDFRVTPDEAIVDIAPGDGSAPRLAARAFRAVRAGEAVLSPPGPRCSMAGRMRSCAWPLSTPLWWRFRQRRAPWQVSIGDD